MERKVLFRVLCGSRAHGTHTETSDYDVRGVYLLPSRAFLGLTLPQETCVKGDDTQWEVGHFCRLALKCNPNIIEAMAAPAMEVSPEGAVLRSMLPLFLSTKEVAGAYKGFARSQRNQAEQGTLARQRINKFLSHYLRALYCGEYLLRTGTPLINVVGTEAEEPCRNAKLGRLTVFEVLDLGHVLESRIDAACERSVLPEHPSTDKINEWLMDLRIQHLGE